ncbi:hypothetical protein, partial [Idiomarina sp. UBA1919]|uniref:hypothetical protein n=1 Tax=Idiomarina sp. UBA1919 TaxID=1946640 RepID=UPI002579D8A4
MKLDFLKTLNDIGMCGLRRVIEPLNESYPLMSHSDWKELVIDLIDCGFVKQHGNGQYQVTPAGNEAIAKGQAFFDELSAEDDEEEAIENSSENSSAESNVINIPAENKPAADHPWRKPLSPNNPLLKDAKSGTKADNAATQQEPAPNKEPHIDNETPAEHRESDFIRLPAKNSETELERLSVDELLVVFNLGRKARDLIEHRLKAHSFIED